MRIYKKLEDCMDDTIKVRDILEYCESAAESVNRLADKAIKSMGKGETTVSACGAGAGESARTVRGGADREYPDHPRADRTAEICVKGDAQ